MTKPLTGKESVYPSGPQERFVDPEPGIPIRLAIAAQVLAGMTSNNEVLHSAANQGLKAISETAVISLHYADALIAAYNKSNEQQEFIPNGTAGGAKK